MNNRIIYDSAITGHHSEYISHLVDYLLKSESKEIFYFIVSEEFKIQFFNIVDKTKGNPSIVWEFIPKKQCDFFQSLPLYKRSFKELAIVDSYAKKFNAQKVLLLYFNIFQLALIFKRYSFEISGILFLQFYRMQKNTFSEKLKYYRKYLITKLYSRNSKIKTVFVLNDDKTTAFLNKKFNTNKFKMLPDPIPQYDQEAGFNLYEYYKIPQHKKVLLHPGAIDHRKGTFEIIEAIDLLQENETGEYAILIVGRAKPDVEKLILEKLAVLKNTNFTIVFDNSFVSNERLKSLFMQSFAVLMPYKNPEASSGILGHAASLNKCVIAPYNGLIGDIVKDNKLGLLINKPTAVDIASGIELLSNCIVNRDLSSDFVAKHSNVFFATTLLKYLK
ncbi:glycosyltransferase [Flavobacterium hibisci]|uniref:glycosyltransferase n=1 Tax=Flavobacterium hibisci TaxID=1914462 RepID=UPI001CBD87F1|nr:glycosyltransferase [Flavobacterium hibisci]MBZ4043050.1 glycosyltransferase [Flavobacterium hibisci]